jgi:hypothetical protein
MYLSIPDDNRATKVASGSRATCLHRSGGTQQSVHYLSDARGGIMFDTRQADRLIGLRWCQRKLGGTR